MFSPSPHWWQTAVFYQVYLRSFACRKVSDRTSGTPGTGDLWGLIEHLDYLQDLGIDAILLSPHYPSPLIDWGYDVTDYCRVAPEYGSLKDFEELLEQAHRRRMRIVADIVLNHTSDQHPWFRESRSSRDNPKRDWYIWRAGRRGGPPNNWCSDFGGPAWEYDDLTEEYYYHFFFKQQPDLNWRNPQVLQTMLDAMRFWLELGVDGFRLDSVDILLEDEDLTDHNANLTDDELYHAIGTTYPALTANPNLAAKRRLMFAYQSGQPGNHSVVRELRAMIDRYPERMLVGETDDPRYYGKNENDELHLVFNFPLLRTFRLTPGWVASNQRQRLASLPEGGWLANTLGNHDASRLLCRYCTRDDTGPERSRDLAQLYAALILTLQGTPFLYYGEEIGMTDLLLDDPGLFRDPLSQWMVQIETERVGSSPLQALYRAARFGRDKNRTPMQWTREANAGFCPAWVAPWLPVNPNYARGVNVADQLDDPTSLLHFYRRLIHLRRRSPALSSGDYCPLLEEAEDCLIYLRRSPQQVCLVGMNFSDRLQVRDLCLDFVSAQVQFSNWGREGEQGSPRRLALAPFEIYIAQVLE